MIVDSGLTWGETAPGYLASHGATHVLPGDLWSGLLSTCDLYLALPSLFFMDDVLARGSCDRNGCLEDPGTTHVSMRKLIIHL